MTDDLVSWLRHQLDEDERIARYSGGTGGWDVGACVPDERMDGHSTEWEVLEEQYPVAHVRGNTRASHVARHSPNRVLAEVQAKRAILDLHRVSGYEDEDMNDLGPGCEECGWNAEHSDRSGWCKTVRLVALPYSDRPGYQDQWKP